MPLFDTARFVRNLEPAYERMWDIYCAGEPPQPIMIADPDRHPPSVTDNSRLPTR